MVRGTQTEVKISELLDRVCEFVNPSELDFYSPTKDFTIELPPEAPSTESPEETQPSQA